MKVINSLIHLLLLLLLLNWEQNCLQIGGYIKSFSDIFSSAGIVLLNLCMIPIPEAQQTITHRGLPGNRDNKLTWHDYPLSLRVKYRHTNIHTFSLYLSTHVLIPYCNLQHSSAKIEGTHSLGRFYWNILCIVKCFFLTSQEHHNILRKTLVLENIHFYY